MSENELHEALASIRDDVSGIHERIGGGWTAFWRGILKGFGSIVGAVLAIIVIGFILNLLGVIPAFRDQAGEWRDVLQQTRQIPQK